MGSSTHAWAIFLLAMGLPMCACFLPASSSVSSLLLRSQRMGLEKGISSVVPPSRAMQLRKPSSTALRMGLFDALKESVGLTPIGIDPRTSKENQAQVAKYVKRVEEKINVLEDEIEKFSDDQLKAKTGEFRARLKVISLFICLVFSMEALWQDFVQEINGKYVVGSFWAINNGT
jgi:hypothetical protein